MSCGWPPDMKLSTKELGILPESDLTAEKARFLSVLRREADQAEGKEVSAEQILKRIGQGWGR